MGTADGEVPEVGPIDLAGLTLKRVQAQKGLGGRAWTNAGYQVPEVIRAPLVAAFAHHREQAARPELRILLQGLEDQWQVRIDLPGALQRIGSGQASLSQHSGYRAVVHVQLA